MNAVQRAVSRVDELQQRSPVLAFLVAVNQKYGGDNGGTLATVLTYNAFLALFPLLLVLVTVLGIVAGGSSSLSHRVLDSALAQFPVIGTQLRSNIHALHRDSAVSMAVGLVGLVWGSLGAAQAGQYAMAEVWNIPKRERPGFLPRLLRSAGLLLGLAVFLAASTALSSLAAGAGSLGLPGEVASGAGSWIVNVGLMAMAFRVLTPRTVPTRQLLPGIVVAGIGWSVLQSAGAFIIDRDLRGSSDVYGFFAIVLGALAWLYLTMRIVVYAAEVNVVWYRRLWPRALSAPPLTDADERMLVTYVEEEARRPEVDVQATVDPPSEPTDVARRPG